MSRKNRKPLTKCKNCEATIKVQDEFCSQCGQENHDHHLTISAVIYEFIEGIIHYDNKVFTTLRTLFTQPGQLSKDYIDGKRIRYVPPVRLYIFTAFIFFFLAGFVLHKTATKILNYTLENKEQTDMTFGDRRNKLNLSVNQFSSINAISNYQDLRKYLDSIIHKDNLSEDKIKKIAQLSNQEFIDSARIEVFKINELVAEKKDNNEEMNVNFGGKDSLVYFRNINNLKKNIPFKLNNENFQYQLQLFVKPDYDSVTFNNREIILKFNKTLLKRIYNEPEVADSVANSKNLNFIQNKNLKHFLTLTSISEFGDRKDARSIMDESVNKFVKYSSFAMYLMMPLSALFLFLLFFRKQKFYFSHFLFSMHLHVLILLLLTVVMMPILVLLLYYPDSGLVQISSILLLLFLILGLAIYFYKAMRFFYETSRKRTFIYGSIISFLYFFILMLIIAVVFAFTLLN